MSSYHDSFTYKNKNSLKDMDLIITSFEPDEGFTESFLSMDSIFEDNYDGTKRFSYGSKYNSVANVEITVMKPDGADFSMSEFRKIAQWITGARTDSWLDMYVGNQCVYSFLGKFVDIQSYKLDARVVGLKFIFESITPWAFSAEETCSCDFGQTLFIDQDGILYAGSTEHSTLSVDESGILYAGATTNICFSLMDEQYYDSVICIDNTVPVQIDNLTDDLYTYINLDMKFTNENSKYLSIKHKYNTIDDVSIEEETKILNMTNGEIVLLSSGQFITSQKLTSDSSVNENTVGIYFVEDSEQLSGYRQVSLPEEYRSKDESGAQILYYRYMPNKHKIFGNDFNFVWPKLAPGINDFAISGEGAGNIQFTYRYPMKIGDNTIDVNKLNPICVG